MFRLHRWCSHWFARCAGAIPMVGMQRRCSTCTSPNVHGGPASFDMQGWGAAWCDPKSSAPVRVCNVPGPWRLVTVHLGRVRGRAIKVGAPNTGQRRSWGTECCPQDGGHKTGHISSREARFAKMMHHAVVPKRWDSVEVVCRCQLSGCTRSEFCNSMILGI